MKAMRPVACDLDILQGEKAAGLGYLLATLAVIVLLEDTTNPLILVILLINVLRVGIRRRFDDMNNNTDSQLVAEVQPQFKLCWLRDEVQKARLVMTLNSRVDSVIKEEDKNWVVVFLLSVFEER